MATLEEINAIAQRNRAGLQQVSQTSAAPQQSRGLFRNRRQQRQQQAPEGKERLSGLGRAASKMYQLGEQIFNLSGFDGEDYETLMSVTPFLNKTVDRERASFREVVPAAWDFMKSIPLGMVTGALQGPAKMYAGVSGENVAAADENGYVNQNQEFDGGDRAAEFIDGFVDAAGLALGATGHVFSTAGRIARGVDEATDAARLAESAAHASEAGRKMAKLENTYNKIKKLNEGPAKTALGKVAWDMGEEAGEEFIQQQMSGIYENGGDWTGENSVWSPGNGYLGQSAGAAWLGAVGGGVMGGAMQGLDYLNGKLISNQSAESDVSETSLPEHVTESPRQAFQGPERWAGELADMASDPKKSSSLAPGRFMATDSKVGLNKVRVSLGHIRAGVRAANNFNPNSAAAYWANKFGIDKTDTVNVENFARMLEGNQDAANALLAGRVRPDGTPYQLNNCNDVQELAALLRDLARANGSQVVVAKAPATNAGPVKLELDDIAATLDNHVAYNPMVGGILNADFDGDKGWIAINDEDTLWDRAYAPSALLGKVDLDYSYFTSKEDVFETALLNAGIEPKTAKKLAAEYKKAISKSDKDERKDALKLVLQKARLEVQTLIGDDNIAESTFANAVSEIQAHDPFTGELSAAARDALQGAKILEARIKESVGRPDIHVQNTSIEGIQGKFTDLLSLYTYLVDFSEAREALFRSGQALVLTLKRADDVSAEGTVEIEVSDMYELFMAANARMEDLGGVPVDTIEGAYKAQATMMTMPLGSFSSREEFTTWLTGDFREDLAKQNQLFNDSCKQMTVEGLVKQFGIREKETDLSSKTEEELFEMFAELFADFSMNTFFADGVIEDGRVITVQEYADIIVADDGIVSGYRSNNIGFDEATNSYLDYFQDMLKKHLGSRWARYERNFDKACSEAFKGRDKVKEKGFNGNESAQQVFFDTYGESWINAVIVLVGRKEAYNLRFGELNSIESHMYYQRLMAAKSEDEFKNIILEMTLHGKYLETLALIEAYNEETDVDARANIATRIRQELYQNAGTSALHQDICKDINNALQAASEGETKIDVQSLFLSSLMNDEFTYSSKVDAFERLSPSGGNRSLIVSARLTNDTDLDRATFMKDVNTSARHMSMADRIDRSYQRKNVEEAQALFSDDPALKTQDAYLFLKRMTEGLNFETNLDLLANFTYTQFFGLTNKSSEKATSELAGQEQYSQALGVSKEQMLPFSAQISGGEYSVIDIRNMSNPAIFLDVFFGRDAYLCIVPGKDDLVFMDQKVLWEECFGMPLNGEPTSAQMWQVLKDFPAIQTYMVPSTTQSADTANGRIVQDSASMSLADAIKSEAEAVRTSLTERQLKRQIEATLMTDTRFMGFFIYMLDSLLGEGYSIETTYKPKEFADLYERAYRKFIDITYNKLVAAAKDGTLDSGDIEQITQEFLGQEIAAVEDRIGRSVTESIDAALSVTQGLLDMNVFSSRVRTLSETVMTQFAAVSSGIQAVSSALGAKPSNMPQTNEDVQVNALLNQLANDVGVAQAQSVQGSTVSPEDNLLSTILGIDNVLLAVPNVQQAALSTQQISTVSLDAMTQIFSEMFGGFFTGDDIFAIFALGTLSKSQSTPSSLNADIASKINLDFLEKILDAFNPKSTLIGIGISPERQIEIYERAASLYDMSAFIRALCIFAENGDSSALMQLQFRSNSFLSANIQAMIGAITGRLNPTVDTSIQNITDLQQDPNIQDALLMTGTDWLTQADLADLYSKNAVDKNTGKILNHSEVEKKISEKICMKVIGTIGGRNGRIVNARAFQTNIDVSQDFTEACKELLDTEVQGKSDVREGLIASFREHARKIEHLDTNGETEYPPIDPYNGALSIAAQRAQFEGFSAMVPMKVGVEGMMQMATTATVFLGPNITEHCDAGPSEIVTLSDFVSKDYIKNNIFDKKSGASRIVRVPESLVATRSDLLGWTVNHNEDGTYDLIINVATEEILRIISRKNLGLRGEEIGIYKTADCTCGSCARHNSPVHDETGVRRTSKTHRPGEHLTKDEREYSEINWVINELVAHCMEAKLLKAKKKFRSVANIILNAPVSKELHKARLKHGDAIEVQQEFARYKTAVIDYLTDIFEDKDELYSMKELGFTRHEAEVLANYTTNAFTIRYEDGTHLTICASKFNTPEGMTEIDEALRAKGVAEVVPLTLSISTQSNRIINGLVYRAARARSNNETFSGQMFHDATIKRLTDYSDMSTQYDPDTGEVITGPTIASAKDILHYIRPRAARNSLVTPTDNDAARLQKYHQLILGSKHTSGENLTDVVEGSSTWGTMRHSESLRKDAWDGNSEATASIFRGFNTVNAMGAVGYNTSSGPKYRVVSSLYVSNSDKDSRTLSSRIQNSLSTNGHSEYYKTITGNANKHDGHLVYFNEGSSNTSTSMLASLDQKVCKRAIQESLEAGRDIYIHKSVIDKYSGDTSVFPMNPEAACVPVDANFVLLNADKYISMGKRRIPAIKVTEFITRSDDIFLLTAGNDADFLGDTGFLLYRDNLNSRGLRANVFSGDFILSIKSIFKPKPFDTTHINYDEANSSDLELIKTNIEDALRSGDYKSLNSVVDIEYWRTQFKDKYSERTICEKMLSYINGNPSAGFLNGELERDDCIGFVRRVIDGDTSHPVFAPVFLSASGLGLNNNVPIRPYIENGKVSFIVDSSDPFEVGGAQKTTATESGGSKQEALIVDDSKAHGIFYGNREGDRSRSDGRFDSTMKKKWYGNKKLIGNLHFLGRDRGYSAWREYNPSTRTWEFRSCFAIPENDLKALEAGIKSVYEKYAYGNLPILKGSSNDAKIAAQEKALRKAMLSGVVHDAPLARMFSPFLFDGDGHMYEFGKSTHDFSYEIVYGLNDWSANEILALYNFFDHDFCPSSQFEPATNDHILDADGNALEPQPDGSLARVDTLIIRLAFVHDNVNKDMSGKAAYSDQAFMDSLMKHGYSSTNTSDIERAIAILSGIAQRQTVYTDWQDDQRNFESSPAYNETGDIYEFAITRGRRLGRSESKIRQFNGLIERMRRNVPTILVDTNDENSTVPQHEMDKLVAKLNSKLGYDQDSSKRRVDERTLKLIYCRLIGWTKSDTDPSINTVRWQYFRSTMEKWIDSLDGELPAFKAQAQDGGRYCLGIVESDIAKLIADSPLFANNGVTLKSFRESMVSEVDRLLGEVAGHLNTGKTRPQYKALQDMAFALLMENKEYDKVNYSIMDSGVSVAEWFSVEEDILGIITQEDREQRERMKAALDRARDCIAAQNKLNAQRETEVRTLDKDTGQYIAAPKTPNSDFKHYTRNAVMISKMMSLLEPLLTVSNAIDTAVKTAYGRSLFFLAEHGIHILDFKDPRIQIPWDVIKNAARNPQMRRLYRLMQQGMIEGETLAELGQAHSEQELFALIDEHIKNKGPIEKGYNKIAYFASGGEAMLTMQIENFLADFYVRSNQRGHTWWQTVSTPNADGTTSEMTVFEQMLGGNPVMFLLNIATTTQDNPDFIEFSQSLNWASKGAMAQRNLVSTVYKNIVRNRPVAQLIQETSLCKFVQYKTNQVGRILNWIAPMSSLHYLAASWVAQNGETLNRISGGKISKEVGAEVEMIISESSLREAIMMDAMYMTVPVLAVCLFGLAGFEPPEDEKLWCNVEEWTIFGYRVGSTWWIEDTLGLALPLAASMKAASLGRPQIKLLTNGIARQCYYNPALQVGEAVRAVLDPDYEMEDYTLDAQMAANARGGAPGRLEWILNSWQALGASWLCQFITPAVVKELYQSTQEFEVSYKRIYEEDGTGRLTEAGREQNKTMYTTYTDMALRKASKKNPVLAVILNTFKQPNTGYLANQMPRTQYYDEEEMLSMQRYSLYEKGDDGKYHLKDDEDVQVALLEIIGTMQEYDDMQELAETGFYLDYNTKAYLSKFIWNHIQNLKNAYYSGVAEGDFDEYALGYGNYDAGTERLAEIQQSYWDDINYWKSFYYDKLWSEPMKRKLTTYNRYNTTYLKDEDGNYYASGYYNNIFKSLPFTGAPGTTEDPEDTAGAENGYASLSAITKTAMFDENGNPMRALIPVEEGYIETPDLDSWEAYDENNPDGGSGDESPYPSYGRRSGGSGGGGGGGGGYLRVPNVNLPYSKDGRIVDVPRTVNPNFDYLRPSFETKGSRQAYKREDLR